MTRLRVLRGPSPSSAAFVHLAALFTTIFSAVVIPWSFAAAAAGHASLASAIVTTAITGAITLFTALAARNVDPLRR